MHKKTTKRASPNLQVQLHLAADFAPLAGLNANTLVQLLLIFFAATLPLYFDLTVAEVSGDIRWMATSFFAGLCGLLLLGHALLQKNKPHLPLTPHGPLLLWVALGLALWAAISLADAINPLRGIILIKALYAQLILMLCVWWVVKQQGAQSANPGLFAHRLLWALAAPLAVTAFIGILQFYGFNQTSFDAALGGTVWVIFTPLFSLLGWLLQGLSAFIPGWPPVPGLVDQLTGFFQQSAVPGGSFANKNLAGSYTAMMVPLMVYLLISAKGWLARGLASGLLSLGLLFLVYSRARASWLALMAALLVGLVLVLAVPALRQAARGWFSRATLLALAVPVVILGLYGGATSPVPGAYAIDRTPAQQLAALGSAAGGWNEYGGRLAYNLNSLVITRDHWFNGVGLGSFFGIYPAYYNALVTTPTNSYNVMARPQRTHTDVMQAFTEMGLPGGVFYVLLFGVGIAMGLRLLGVQAGRLGGAIIGLGLVSTLFMLSCFLQYRGLLQLPGAWQYVYLATLLGLMAWAGLRAWHLTMGLNHAPAAAITPLEPARVTGFFATLGLLTICLNGFLDFPMQLPTAPAAAAMLVGLLLALHGAAYPTSWLMGWAKTTLKLPRRATLVVAMVVLALAWVWALHDAYKFRQANIILKAAMVRIYSGMIDDYTIELLEAANTVYPYDPRVHENMGVVYANYQGPLMTTAQKIEKLEWVLAGDPWAANHMVNLAGQYIAYISEARMQGDEPRAQAGLKRLQALSQRLMRVADFSHMAWGVLGITNLLANQPAAAVPLLQRALTIEPSYAPAQQALQTAIALTGTAPLVVNDAALQPRPTPTLP